MTIPTPTPTPGAGAASEFHYAPHLTEIAAILGAHGYHAAARLLRQLRDDLVNTRTPAPVMEGAQREAVVLPREEVERAIKALRYASHPYPSPNADALEAFLKAAPPPPDRVQPERVEAETPSQKMAKAGFVRRPSHRALPSDDPADDPAPPTDASGGVTEAMVLVACDKYHEAGPFDSEYPSFVRMRSALEATDRARNPVDASAQGEGPMDVEPEYYESLPIIEAKDETVMDELVKHMVNRFLGWRLPKPWRPDNGISYTRPNYAHPPADHDWPVGTNLFDATQAEAMVRYMLEGAPPPPDRVQPGTNSIDPLIFPRDPKEVEPK